MTNYADYLTWLADGGWIRTSARAIIFNAARDRILVERNDWMANVYFNFVGGGVEVNETLEECIARELGEETDARITAARYLFVVENFFAHEGALRHALEHYFELELDSEEVTPDSDGVAFHWLPVKALDEVDLRPTIVRDAIIDGRYARVKHLVLREDGGDGA